MRSYVIGDIQGCHNSLLQLVAAIDRVHPGARLLLVGDLVNRGPDSLGTLRTLMAMGQRVQTILGNHDLHLLAVAHGIRAPHSADTLDAILEAPDRDQLLDWLRRQPLAWFEDDHLLVHAGVLPQWSAQQTMALAHEVETALRGPDWPAFLAQMYGNKPARWDDALQGADRLRCIVNGLTRLRFCRPDGTMDFHGKQGLDGAPPGYLPWFDVPGRRSADVCVVSGHWSTLGLILRPNLITLDTGCVWGGQLSAVCLQDRSVVQVECPACQLPGGS